MGLIGKMIRSLGSSARSGASPEDVRALIDRNALDEARAALGRLLDGLPDAEAQRLCLGGEIAYTDRQDEAAEAAFRAALKLAPGLAAAHYGLSLMLAEKLDFDGAVRHAQFAVGAIPDEARFLAQLGYCHMGLGNFEIAEAPLRRATVLNPLLPHAWNNLGIIMRLRERHLEARDYFRKALELKPGFPQAEENLAAIGGTAPTATTAETTVTSAEVRPPELDAVLEFEATGDLDAAIGACEVLMLRDDDIAESAAVESMRLYERTGDHRAGIDALKSFLARRPSSPRAAAALGYATLESLEYKEAETHLRRVLSDTPESVRGHVSMAQALIGQERFPEALVHARQAAALAPEDWKVTSLLGTALFNCCLYDEALAVCEALIAAGRPATYYGSILGYLERFDEALAVLDKEVARVPSDPGPRFQRSQIRLLHLDFERGWDDYAVRGLSYSKHYRVLPFPQWKGEPLAGKRIVVLAEQGLGDQVMLSSCLPDLLALGPSEVIVEAIDRIAPTLARSYPACRVVPTKQNREMTWVKELDDVDFFIPMGDLPRRFRRSLSDFPKRHSYLIADPARIAFWRGRLAEQGPGPYIGMSWHGGTAVTRTTVRSMTPAELQPLASRRSATWVCLQYGKVGKEVEAARAAGFPLTWWAESIADLDEFAALISALDLVITVCNTTVHYAGAVGTPVWVIAPKVPEWRYGLSNDVLPWYPSSRMFRQARSGHWEEPLARVGHMLSSWSPPQKSQSSGSLAIG